MKSKLPQRRKSDEEIARLRKNLGIPAERGKPGPPPLPETGKDEAPVRPARRPENEAARSADSVTAPKRESEAFRMRTPAKAPAMDAGGVSAHGGPSPTEARPEAPALSTWKGKLGTTELPAPMPPPETLPSPVETLPSRPGAAGRGKPVRSLKRSERMPAPVRPAMESEEKRSKQGDSQLPDHRHDDRELQRIRVANAMAVKPPVEQIKSLAAHPALVVLGYLLALAGGVGGIAIALYFFLKKPRSQYHAAFMTIIAMLVLVFGILYFIPQPDAP